MAITFPIRPGYVTTTGQDLIPNPGKVPVTAGHWHRASKDAPVTPKPRLICKPTGGKVDRSPVSQYPKRRKAQPVKGPSGKELHAAWSKGKDIFA